MTNAAINAAKTHCDYGHEFTQSNTKFTVSGARRCRQCTNDRANARRAPNKRLPTLQRLLANATRTEAGCLEWQGQRTEEGYPATVANGRYYAHVAVYELTARTKLPAGWVVHHTCINPPCIEYEHLLACTSLEHIKIHNMLKTHCKHNHELTEDNVYRTPQGTRVCKACRRRRDRDRKRRVR